MVAGGHRRDGAGRGVHAHEVRAAVLGRDREDRPAVGRPDRLAGLAAARRVLVAADAAADGEVVAGRQVVRRRAGAVLDHPQVRLVVGSLRRVVRRAGEGDRPAVGAEGVAAHAAVEGQELRRLAARRRHRVQIGAALLVVRLLHVARREVESRAVGRPLHVALGELAARDLLRVDRWLGRPRHRDRPDVRVAGRIQVTAAVRPVDRARDHAHVALLLPGLLFVLARLGRAREGDGAPVGRPRRRRRAAGERGERPRLAAVEREQVDLRRGRTITARRRPHERNRAPVGRPSRGRVARPRRQPAGRLARVGRHEPQVRVVAVLLPVHGHARVDDRGAVGRDLRVGDPHELREVRFGDGARAVGAERHGHAGEHGRQDDGGQARSQRWGHGGISSRSKEERRRVRDPYHNQRPGVRGRRPGRLVTGGTGLRPVPSGARRGDPAGPPYWCRSACSRSRRPVSVRRSDSRAIRFTTGETIGESSTGTWRLSVSDSTSSATPSGRAS